MPQQLNCTERVNSQRKTNQTKNYTLYAVDSAIKNENESQRNKIKVKQGRKTTRKENQSSEEKKKRINEYCEYEPKWKRTEIYNEVGH